MWQIPEAELQVLGDVSGKDVLELGCGAAQWSISLAGLGARPVGLDLTPRQLEHARRDVRHVRAPARIGPAVDARVEIHEDEHDHQRSDHHRAGTRDGKSDEPGDAETRDRQ